MSTPPTFDSKRLIYYVFIAAMAVLFALQWGPGSRGCNKAGKAEPQEVAATVNGKDIPLKDYAYNETRYRMLAQSNPAAAERLITEAQKELTERWQRLEQMAKA